MKKITLSALLVLVAVTGYFLSPFSYFTVSFQKPLTPKEYLAYLSDNGINPGEHPVYVFNSSLQRSEEIYRLDYQPKDQKLIRDTVFNTRPYAFKALFDHRVESWTLAGLRHPYD